MLHWPASLAPRRWYADALVAGTLVAALYGLMHLSRLAPGTFSAGGINLEPYHLPYFAFRSLLRMLAAYVLSLAFSLGYGYVAAYNARAERILVPTLDVLQSIPVLSFMPSVVLALVAIFPHGNMGTELASIILIFTGQAWNMTFSFYHSLRTIPSELREVAAIQQMNGWQRFRTLELPFSTVGLVWNSMMSWAGGWFFLMASEMFALGDNQFTLPGLGSYLQAAANAGNIRAVVWGVGTLVLVIVLLDLLIWRPVVAWADKFKIELIQSSSPPRSAVLTILRRSRLVEALHDRVLLPLDRGLDRLVARRLTPNPRTSASEPAGAAMSVFLSVVFAGAALWGVWKGIRLLGSVPLNMVPTLLLATMASLLRVATATAIGVLWTVPVGVLIGSNPKIAAYLQPVVLVLASIPATALFPVLLLVLLRLPGGLSLAAIVLMLMGTQWYILFNVIAGASAIPADLKEAGVVYHLTGWQRWKTLILPAIFPHLVTGLVTASGGAWNATIVSEYVHFHGETHSTVGLGALIAGATESNNFPLLLAATLVLAVMVVSINRLVWRPLYHLAETKYSLL